MRISNALSLILFGLASLATAQTYSSESDPRAPQPKAAWEWTTEERLAARLNAAPIKERSAGTPSAVTVQGQGAQFVIDGRKNPELFLPYELFNWLIGGFDPDSRYRETLRSTIGGRIKSFGYTDDREFWSDLGKVTASYVSLRGRHAELNARISKANRADCAALQKSSDDLGPQLCRSRAQALAAARSYFGRERFDRFLYEVVAPILTVGSGTPSPEEAKGLRFIEGGCQ